MSSNPTHMKLLSISCMHSSHHLCFHPFNHLQPFLPPLPLFTIATSLCRLSLPPPSATVLPHRHPPRTSPHRLMDPDQCDTPLLHDEPTPPRTPEEKDDTWGWGKSDDWEDTQQSKPTKPEADENDGWGSWSNEQEDLLLDFNDS